MTDPLERALYRTRDEPPWGDFSEVERVLEELDAQARADAFAREWDPEDMFPDDMIDNAAATPPRPLCRLANRRL